MIGRAHGVDLVLGLAVLALCAWMGFTAQGFSPFASIFPLFIAAGCGGLTLVLLALATLGRLPAPPVATGFAARRVGAVVAIALWIALIPIVGFAPASVVGFVAVGVTAKYEPWTARQWLLFCLLAVACVAVLTLFFIHALGVPLPQGSLFRG